MGSEFSYEDLVSRREDEKYTHKLIKEEKTKEDLEVWLIERTTKNKKSSYKRLKAWVSKKYRNPLKVEYFDRKNELIKTATFSNYKQYKVGKKALWRANKVHMINVQTGKKSTIMWREKARRFIW